MTPQDQSVPTCFCGKENCERYGLCHCGCGKPTRGQSNTNRRLGFEKGQPRLYAGLGHCLKIERGSPKLVFVDSLPVVMLPLTMGLFASIDAEQYLRARELDWTAHYLPHMGKYRAVSRAGPRFIYLHRFILEMDDGDKRLIDHENGNPLDNRVRNLRFANKAKNGWNRGKPKTNTSGYKGVSWCKKKRKWVAQIVANKKSYYLGSFDTKEEAYAAYCEAAYRLHGEFARVA